jgi:hypothetical protein
VSDERGRREPRDAARRFLTALGRVTECVTAQRLLVLPGTYAEPGEVYVITFGPAGDPIPLRAKAGGQSGYLLDVQHRYTIVPDPSLAWRVTTLSYQYRLLDSQQNEILAYHWDRFPRYGPRHPHIHVTAASQIYPSSTVQRTLRLEGLHIPTGRVSLESIVWFLIRDLGIEDRVPRWIQRLRSSMAIFHAETTNYP